MTWMTWTVAVVGILILAAGVSMPLVGFRKVEGWATWWLSKPDSVIRGWSLLTISLGFLLIRAAA